MPQDVSNMTTVTPRDTLLASSCSICHLNPIKYTCPRCSTHTCSLTCVRKHKQWTQCSGIRDPAEYRKRTELATASSIDKDFNFITSVERTLSRAETTNSDRGIDLVPARFARHADHRPRLEVVIENRGVKVVRAPKGLSRNKNNKTSWASNVKAVMWTVEWLLEDNKIVMGQALESKDLKELYMLATGRIGRRGKKRSTQTDGETHAKRGKSEAATNAQDTPVSVVAERLEAVDSMHDTKITSDYSIVADHELDGQFFYLHKPDTSSKFKCLIPVAIDQSLRQTLEGQVVFEYPTFYIKRVPPDKLEAPFISEAKYLQQYGQSIPVQLGGPVEAGEIFDDDIARAKLPAFDERKVVEILKQDLQEA